MQRLSYHVAVSVDGFIAEADGRFDRFLMTGEHLPDYLAAVRSHGTVLMGRKTYQVGIDAGVVDPYPHARTYVFSRTPRPNPHPNVSFTCETPSTFVARLRREEGSGIYLVGGADIAGQLLLAGQVDEVTVKVNPVAFGQGVPLFACDPTFRSLRHTATKVFANGVVVSTYQPHLAPSS